MEDMLALIKQGVKLKPVSQEVRTEHALSPTATPSEKHTQQLKEVIDRISMRLNHPSEENSDESDYADFDD